MESNDYGARKYAVIDRETGEEVPFDILFEQLQPDGWQQAYARTISDYFQISGGAAMRVLVHFIKNKDANNRIIGTVRSLSKDIGVTHTTVAEVIRKLKEKNFLHRLQNGVYMLSPAVLSFGGKKGIILMREWGEVTEV